MISWKSLIKKYLIILSERYSIRLLTLIATLPLLDSVNLSFYASYSICQFICSLYLAGFQEVSRNLISEQRGNISISQKKFSKILACSTSLLVINYVIFFAREFPLLSLLSFSPFINLVGFNRTLAIESSGNLLNLALLRILSVMVGVGISYGLLPTSNEYSLVLLSLICDFLICISIFVLRKPSGYYSEIYEDPNFLHLSFRNVLIGLKPILERFGILLFANAALSGTYSLAFQIISSYVGILIYSFNSLIQILRTNNEIDINFLNRGYLYIILISILLFPGLNLVGSNLFQTRWNVVLDFVLAILASKLIGIQNLLSFNDLRKNFSKGNWTRFYLHIPLISVLISVGFHLGRSVGLVCIVVSGFLESSFYCGNDIFRNRNFLMRVSFILFGLLFVRKLF